ncbi:MAG: recombinase zinc beta ribbon domain-containing protein, partial [Candidatus Liptonbacteria bacterium]|nr:recombinase zinc beta ribbon domain-containing protein [Candidatus Liptonbacteria bacterium]
PSELLRILNEDWKFKSRKTKRYAGKSLSRSGIYRIFTNPFYYGWIEYGNPKQFYRGSHDPMVTEEEYDRVQKLLGSEGRPRPKEHRFAFTGLMKCGNCGAMITAEEKIKRQQNGNVHYYVYYHCTKRKDEGCIEKMIKLEDLNAQIDLALKGLTISDKFKGWAIKYLHEVRQTEAQSNQSILEGKQKSLARITDQLQNILLKYTSPENANEEIMTAQELQTLKSSLLKQKVALESDLKAQGQTIEEWVEMTERTFNFARYAKAWFENGTMETKRAVFSALGSHLSLKGQKVSIIMHPFYKVIFENLDAVEKELLQVRTSESVVSKREILEILAKCPALRGQ